MIIHIHYIREGIGMLGCMYNEEGIIYPFGYVEAISLIVN